jgi:hypothetical protein
MINSAPPATASSQVSAEPAERFPALFRSAGFLFRRLFTRKPDRWYSEEDVRADLEHCSSEAM